MFSINLSVVLNGLMNTIFNSRKVDSLEKILFKVERARTRNDDYLSRHFKQFHKFMFSSRKEHSSERRLSFVERRSQLPCAKPDTKSLSYHFKQFHKFNIPF